MSDWSAAAAFYHRQRATAPSFDVIDDMYRSRAAWNALSDRPAGWFDLVKMVRSVFLVSIDETHRLILDHPGFRGLVQHAIDTNAECASYARKGIRKGWLEGVAELRDDRPVIHLTWRSASPGI